MTDTEFTPRPETPAAVAAAVLDAIEAQPDVFHTDQWAFLAESLRLAPDQAPACGSQLCCRMDGAPHRLDTRVPA